MSWNTLYSLRKLITEADRLAASCETVSFDLFDTLLIRRIHDPDLVKIPVARYISCLAAKEKIKISWQSIQKIRDEVEKRHRAEAGAKYPDHEACYPVFMKEALERIFQNEYHKMLLDQVTAYELSMESSMLVPRQLLKEWMHTQYESGKQLFIISDIYLPAGHLKILVERAGMLHLVKDVISSADTFQAKASGKAYPLIQEKYGLDVSSWLHIGDNPISDGLRAAEHGLQALVLRDAGEKHRKAIIKRYYNYGKGRQFYRGRALQQLMLPHEGENIKQPDLYVEGYNFLGPMIGAFVQHIAEQCRKLNLTKVFFLSREGFTFKKVWDESVQVLFPDRQLPEVQYLYVSRMALAGASCAHQGLTLSSMNIAFLPPGNRDLRDVARIFGFDLEKMIPYLKAHKLEPDSCLSPQHEGYDPQYSVRAMELLEDREFQAEVKRQTASANEALIRYLEESSFFSHKQVAIVDIGWLGTIQRFLYDAVKHRDDCPRLSGFVFGATRGIPYPEDLKNALQGVIYDRDRFDLAASSILYARDVFEEACRAPHPTLNGYKLTSDGYDLIFRDVEDAIGRAEKEQDAYFSQLQQGIVDAAPRFAAASALLGYSLDDYRAWFNYVLAAKLAFPKTSEVVNIRHKHHLDDFHGTHKPSKGKGEKQLWDCGPFALRLSPLLRLRYFWRHVRHVLKN